MQFLVLGYDGKDNEALSRRQAMREQHITLSSELMEKGNMWFGASLRDEKGTMIGSALFMNFKDKEALQKWLDIEPYMVGKVWEKVEIKPCSVRDPWLFSRARAYYEKSTK
ncbi:MAG: YciI family protein [Candidatus Levyibacteriota bacterium]